MQDPKTDFFQYRVRNGAYPSCTLNYMDKGCSDVYASDTASYSASDVPKDFYSDFGDMWMAWRLGVDYYDMTPQTPWDHYQKELFRDNGNGVGSERFPKEISKEMSKEGFFGGGGPMGMIVVIFFIIYLLYRVA